MKHTKNWSLFGHLQPIQATFPKIIVVGAGMAGLTVARLLQDSGFPVTILEARHRIGGRMWTNHDLGGYIDLGASWIHGADHNPLTNWCQKLGIEMPVTPNDERSFGIQGEWIPWAHLSEQVVEGLAASERRLAECKEAGSNEDCTIADLIEPLLNDSTLPGLDRRVLAWMTGGAEGVQAGLAHDLSVRWWQPKELSIVNAMPLGGYQQLLDDVAQGLDIQLDTPVSRIVRENGRVTLHTPQQRFVADRVIITVPLGVLKAGKIEFDPPLPASKQSAIEQIGFGGGVLNKIAIRFPYRFWPDAEDRFISLPATVAERGIFANWINCEPLNAAPILLSFSTGANGAKMDRTATDEQVYHEAMKSLRRIFGNALPEAESYLVTRWLSDPWALGSYSYEQIGSDDSKARQAYAAPIADQLFFAGEATDLEEFGTVHAALLSGEQAALAIFESVTGEVAKIAHLPYAFPVDSPDSSKP